MSSQHLIHRPGTADLWTTGARCVGHPRVEVGNFGCSMGTCCDLACVDTSNSLQHCGACGAPCLATTPNTIPVCVASACANPCAPGFLDCDRVAPNGCEYDARGGGACVCQPGVVRPCYSGKPGTKGVGRCHGGSETCASDGLKWGDCVGEVVPGDEICANGVDENCNGSIDESNDEDGDGFTVCAGDCCDAPSCPNASLINPAAFDVQSNGVDDDCNGSVDDVRNCDTGLAFDSLIASESALAMDLCPGPVGVLGRYGVVSANWRLSSGSGTPAPLAHTIRSSLGSNVVPQRGQSFLVMSTGTAAAPGQTGFGGPAMDTNHSLSSSAPSDWWLAHAGVAPGPADCPGPSSCAGSTCSTWDPVMLELEVKAPSNAQAFRGRVRLFSADYPEAVCGPYVDTFLVLLRSSFSPSSSEVANPADLNIGAVVASSRTLSANLAHGNTGLFSQCVNGPTGCASGAVPGDHSACLSTAGLAGTGFDVSAAGLCSANARLGGGTDWLVFQGNVVPGETFNLRLVLWDTGDGTVDTTAVVDGFEWLNSRVVPGL